MSGKSRYGGVISSASRYDTAAEETRSTTAAVTVAIDAAVQASWAQYVQNLVSERIAAIRDGVIGGVGEAINEQLDHLFNETNELLRRELNANSAKVEAAPADIRAAAIRLKLRSRRACRQ